MVKVKLTLLRDAYRITQFNRLLEYHLENLSLINPATQESRSDLLMGLKIKTVDLVQINHKVCKNIELSPNVKFNALLSPIICDKYRSLRLSKMSDMSFMLVPDFQVISCYIDVFPLESSIIIAAYVAEIISLPTFLFFSKV